MLLYLLLAVSVMAPLLMILGTFFTLKYQVKSTGFKLALGVFFLGFALWVITSNASVFLYAVFACWLLGILLSIMVLIWFLYFNKLIMSLKEAMATSRCFLICGLVFIAVWSGKDYYNFYQSNMVSYETELWLWRMSCKFSFVKLEDQSYLLLEDTKGEIFQKNLSVAETNLILEKISEAIGYHPSDKENVMLSFFLGNVTFVSAYKRDNATIQCKILIREKEKALILDCIRSLL